MNVLFYLTMTFFIIVCLFLILLILIQKGRGGGLASAFGGAGGQTAFGSKTGDVLTWATSIVFGIFMLLAVALNLIANHIDAARGGISEVVPPAHKSPMLPNDPGSDLPKATGGDPGPVPKQPANLTVPASASPTLPSTMSIGPGSPVPTVAPAMAPTGVPTATPATQPIAVPSTLN